MHAVAFGTRSILNCLLLGRNTPQTLFFFVRVYRINTTSVVASIKDIIASFHYTNQELNYVLCAEWEGRTKIFSLR